MQVLIWFLVYLLLIVALTVWRDHHDAARRAKRRRAGRSLRGSVKHVSRTS